jgi:hypothetical protein
MSFFFTKSKGLKEGRRGGGILSSLKVEGVSCPVFESKGLNSTTCFGVNRTLLFN